MNKRALALLAFALLTIGGLSWAGAKLHELQHQVATHVARTR